MMKDQYNETLSKWIDENLSPRANNNRRHPTGVLKAMYQTNDNKHWNPEVSYEEFNEMMKAKGFISDNPNKFNTRWKVKVKNSRY